MGYTDYSAQFVLDQFLTYLNANQLGANDQHLYDTIAAEHNINTATVDGTHKENSILGSYINKNPISDGSQTLSGGAYWTPYPTGVYQLSYHLPDIFSFQLNVSDTWMAGSSIGLSGIYFFDGVHMRVYCETFSGTHTFYYQKF